MDDRMLSDYDPNASTIRPPRMRLATAYVPWQRYGRTFSPREALMKGTLFPELYQPYGKHYR